MSKSTFPVLKSPVGVSKAVVVLLGVTAAIDLFALWVGFEQRSLAADFVAGRFSAGSDADADRIDSLYSAAAVAQLCAMVATAVVFIVWFRRVRINAEVFRPDGHSRSRGWASWGWFVPVMNLWAPRQVATDTWDASVPEADLIPRKYSRKVINSWWSLWLVSNVIGRLAGSQYDKAESIGEIKTATEMLMLSDALDIAAAVAAIMFVRALTRMQDEKALRGPAMAPFPA
ncbi:DUF4328 domain-containing protein [Streptomyces sp. NBC_01445]|uniref:DUF4328 domain-containing protein n=1 Tax=Streptomyces sp. NBC_01445 TaxID=2903869 RepID=UPI002DDB35DC|nr:DUF4328 domain-containing protein [Streptomyces sp. NBC_01445]WSE05530.1 DUF4328 domain-containing protein [Streptomyces sp. NBC_01445]